MKTRHPSFLTAGFSLVEIALAMGIAMFALVSVVGLLRVALEADSDAGRDSALATMSSQVVNQMRLLPFDSLWAEDPSTDLNAQPSKSVPEDTTYYFTAEGTMVPSAAAGNPETIYQCVVKKTPDPETQSLANEQYNKLLIRLEFSWPVRLGGQPALKTNTHSINVAIARY